MNDMYNSCINRNSRLIMNDSNKKSYDILLMENKSLHDKVAQLEDVNIDIFNNIENFIINLLIY